MKLISIWRRAPLIRGWVARLLARRQKSRLRLAHALYSEAVSQRAISEIRFDKSGCTYLLADGRRYRFDPSRAAGWLYSVPYSGAFEEKETEFVKSLIRPGWVCFDVGACFGWYTVLLSKAAQAEGKVYAFEPVHPNFECLRDNVGLNACHNVVLENRALGERPGRLKLYLPRDGVSASMKPHGGEANCEVMEAEVTTLDDFVERSAIAKLDFLKADIEGAELLLLKGGAKTLAKYKPTLMLEVQAHSTRLFGYMPEALFTLLRNMGYRAHYVSSNGALVMVGENEMSSLPDYNFVFVHPERRL